MPAGLYLSAALSWRAAFGVIAGIAAATGAVVAKRAPARAEPRSEPRPWSQLTTALVDGGVRRLLATTLLAYLGEFVVYSYLEFALVEVSRTPDRALPAAYLIFGVAGVAGNLLSGRASDRLPPGRVAAGGLLVLAASLIAFPLLLPHPAVVPVALCGCGAGAWIVSVPQQQRLLIACPSAAQTVLGLNQAPLYLGISGSAILGAVLIPAIGVGRLGFAGAVLELAALGVSCTI